MAKKRKNVLSLDRINQDDHDPRFYVDKHEIMMLTKLVKEWEFTCSFCFKRFPSAQALGGHQNAHRSERMAEKRNFVRDPIGYRKRVFIIAKKYPGGVAAVGGGAPNLHAAGMMVKEGEVGEFNVAGGGDGINNFCKDSSSKDSSANSSQAENYINGENLEINPPPVVINFFPPKELNLSERVGMHAENGEGWKACFEFNNGGYGMDLDQELDLTLKL